MRELLRLEHLSYSYDDDRAALTDVSVSLYAGQRVAVLGNNGAGKSTFFLCCNGVLRPSAGDIYLDGERLGSKNPDRSRR